MINAAAKRQLDAMFQAAISDIEGVSFTGFKICPVRGSDYFSAVATFKGANNLNTTLDVAEAVYQKVTAVEIDGVVYDHGIEAAKGPANGFCLSVRFTKATADA